MRRQATSFDRLPVTDTNVVASNAGRVQSVQHSIDAGAFANRRPKLAASRASTNTKSAASTHRVGAPAAPGETPRADADAMHTGLAATLARHRVDRAPHKLRGWIIDESRWPGVAVACHARDGDLQGAKVACSTSWQNRW